MSSDSSPILVGAINTNNNAGTVYTFEASSGGTWVPTGQLVPNIAPTQGGLYGFSTAVSHDGSTVLVGAPNANSGAGAVYVFKGTNGGGSWGPATAVQGPSGAMNFARVKMPTSQPGVFAVADGLFNANYPTPGDVTIYTYQ